MNSQTHPTNKAIINTLTFSLFKNQIKCFLEFKSTPLNVFQLKKPLYFWFNSKMINAHIIQSTIRNKIANSTSQACNNSVKKIYKMTHEGIIKHKETTVKQIESTKSGSCFHLLVTSIIFPLNIKNFVCNFSQKLTLYEPALIMKNIIIINKSK